jgi:hypothetical protein
MTKSRIALSKINRFRLGSERQPTIRFSRTATRFEPEKNTSGNTRSRSTADEQTNRVPRCVKRKSSGERRLFSTASAVCMDAKPKPARPYQLSLPKIHGSANRVLAPSVVTSPTARRRVKKRTFANGRQAHVALRQPAAGRLHRREPITEADPNSDGFSRPGLARRLHCEARAQRSVFGFHCRIA